MTGSGDSWAVIDASFAIRTVLFHPSQQVFQDAMARLVASGTRLVAPVLWIYETTSAITKAVRLGHLEAADGLRTMELLAGLEVELIPPDGIQNKKAFEWTLKLQRAAAYDSYYLALAETLGCDLWTADRKLANAVGQPWVLLVGAME